MKQISPDHDAAQRVLKITRKRIESALQELQKKRLHDEAIHEARRSLKKARAGLRLLRPGLKDSHYKKANAALRDAARPLGAVRDAKVLSDTLGSLVELHRAPPRSLQLVGLRRVLKRHRRDTRHRILHDPKVLAHSRQLLRRTRASMVKWKLQRQGWALLGPALGKVYAKGRAAGSNARKTATAEALHEWRKQVKYLRHGLRILEPLWPAVIGELAHQADELSDYLGDSHDLTTLCDLAIAHPDAFGNQVTLDALLALGERRQQELTRKAKLLGSLLFEEKPRVLARRFGQYWRDWRQSAATP